ncbi:hypothetical protein [Pseudonocardia kunmingensis]|uniref:hypothetical protein n=1 Tax=Pseudonocardia kunmingensis TaxID=630975 RepID=UPI001478CBA9|nr:hypothetical protein [Pseudonocardia kunmingensis]
MTLQNRSYVPIIGTHFRLLAVGEEGEIGGLTVFDNADEIEGGGAVVVDLLPPCAILVLDAAEMQDFYVATLNEWDTVVPPDPGAPRKVYTDAVVSYIEFGDVNGFWRARSGGQPESIEQDDFGRTAEDGDLWIEAESTSTAGDCGSG